jgi:hypothetical protein
MSLFAVLNSSILSLAVLFLKFSNSANSLRFLSFSIAKSSSALKEISSSCLSSVFPTGLFVLFSLLRIVFPAAFCFCFISHFLFVLHSYTSANILPSG